MPIWDDVITERDRQVYEKSGYGNKIARGGRPAVLVVDVVTAFIGDKREPILKSIERFPNSCGEEGWIAVQRIRSLLEVARIHHVPIYYTASPRQTRFTSGKWAEKHPRVLEASNVEYGTRDAIPDEIAPGKEDTIIEKAKPSPFFGTPLLSYLISSGIDTLVVAGCTTSGCVRATVIDAFSYNYPTLVVEECVFDRGQASHKVNLFDMNQKYADVIPLPEAISYLSKVGTNSP
jgi:nicotinamidase-related amidase